MSKLTVENIFFNQASDIMFINILFKLVGCAELFELFHDWAVIVSLLLIG